MSNEFLPEGYEAPKTENNYLKFEDGETRFRILQSPTLGYEGWSNDDKPIRFKNVPTEDQVALLRDSKFGGSKYKHFWSLLVYSYSNEKIMCLNITQSSIIGDLTNYAKSVDWGTPLNYDIKVVKTGEKKETRYNVLPVPPKPFEALTTDELAIELSNIDLEELFITDGNPFKRN